MSRTAAALLVATVALAPAASAFAECPWEGEVTATPALRHDGQRGVLVWQEGDVGLEPTRQMVAVLDEAGAVEGVSGSTLDPGAEPLRDGGVNALLGVRGTDVVFQRLDDGASPFRETVLGLANGARPRAAFDGEAFVVAWVTAPNQLRLVRVAPSGAILADRSMFFETTPFIEVVSDGETTWVVGTDSVFVQGPGEGYSEIATWVLAFDGVRFDAKPSVVSLGSPAAVSARDGRLLLVLDHRVQGEATAVVVGGQGGIGEFHPITFEYGQVISATADATGWIVAVERPGRTSDRFPRSATHLLIHLSADGEAEGEPVEAFGQAVGAAVELDGQGLLVATADDKGETLADHHMGSQIHVGHYAADGTEFGAPVLVTEIARDSSGDCGDGPAGPPQTDSLSHIDGCRAAPGGDGAVPAALLFVALLLLVRAGKRSRR